MKYYSDNRVLTNKYKDRFCTIVQNAYKSQIDFFFLNNVGYVSDQSALVKLITKYSGWITKEDDDLASSIASEIPMIRTMFNLNTPESMTKSNSLFENKTETWVVDASVYGLTKASMEWQNYNSIRLIDHQNTVIDFLPQTIWNDTDDLVGLINVSELMLQYKYFYMSNNINNTPINFVTRYIVPKLVKDYINIAILNRMANLQTEKIIKPKTQSGLYLPSYEATIDSYINELKLNIKDKRLSPGNIFNNIYLLDTIALDHFNIDLPPNITYEIYEILLDFKAYKVANEFNKPLVLARYESFKSDLLKSYSYHIYPKRNHIHSSLLETYLKDLL